MIAFAAGIFLGSTFGVCVMGALWARERDEQTPVIVQGESVTELPVLPFSRRGSVRMDSRRTPRPALAH